MITDADDSTSQHVTVINEAMAKKFFPGENPLGKRLIELGMDSIATVPMTVVGVVGDVRSDDLSKRAAAAALRAVSPATGARVTSACSLLRTKLIPASRRPGCAVALRAIDANVLTTRRDDGRHPRRGPSADRRFTMMVLERVRGARAGARGDRDLRRARRTPSLGARARSACAWRSAPSRSRVVAHGAARFADAGRDRRRRSAWSRRSSATRLMRTLLYGVSATDPVTFAGVVAVLLGGGGGGEHRSGVARGARRSDRRAARGIGCRWVIQTFVMPGRPCSTRHFVAVSIGAPGFVTYGPSGTRWSTHRPSTWHMT